MTINVSSSDTRDLAALRMLLDAARWQKRIVLKNGRRCYGIPSRSRPGLFWLTDGSRGSCQCPDSQRNGQHCAHERAAALYRVQRQDARALRAKRAAQRAGSDKLAETLADHERDA